MITSGASDGSHVGVIDFIPWSTCWWIGLIPRLTCIIGSPDADKATVICFCFTNQYSVYSVGISLCHCKTRTTIIAALEVGEKPSVVFELPGEAGIH